MNEIDATIKPYQDEIDRLIRLVSEKETYMAERDKKISELTLKLEKANNYIDELVDQI